MKKKTPASIKIPDGDFSLVGVAYGSNPADGHAHQWVRGSTGDFCLTCRTPWADAMRGFGSNVAPPRQR